jgi:hypothetical protein
MRILAVKRCQADGLHPQHAAEPILSPEPPRLWSQLPAAMQQQLAQQMAQLIQRLRLSADLCEREGDVEHLTDD